MTIAKPESAAVGLGADVRTIGLVGAIATAFGCPYEGLPEYARRRD